MRMDHCRKHEKPSEVVRVQKWRESEAAEKNFPSWTIIAGSEVSYSFKI
jgi:hypothetical protein